MMTKIPVYMMPGLAASSSIFERIILPDDIFETVLLEWEIPFDKETLPDYAKRIANKIQHQNPVLIGVSFGGILVQEMAKCIETRKIIIISIMFIGRVSMFSLLIAMVKREKYYNYQYPKEEILIN